MPAPVVRFEDHRTLEPQLEATSDWLLIRQAAIDGFNLQIAIGLEAAEIHRRHGRHDLAAQSEDTVNNLRRALARATAWSPLAGEIPRAR